MDSIAGVIIADAYMKDKVVFDVFGYFTPEEANHNRFIGVSRSKVVIDYFVQHWDLPRSHWRIVDLDTTSAAYRPTTSVAITSGHSIP